MNFIPYYVYMYICCTVEINSTTTTTTTTTTTGVPLLSECKTTMAQRQRSEDNLDVRTGTSTLCYSDQIICTSCSDLGHKIKV